jgi:predicted NAD/FAD-binding protein
MDPRAPGSRLAVIGAGVSGLVAAHRLAHRHEVTVFEAEPRLGGHSHTVEVEVQGRPVAVDTGFIVYNDRTYPLFSGLLRELDVATTATTMSFSVRCARTGLEYNGTSFDGLFAQRRNLLRPRFWAMLREILRFNKVAVARLPELPPELPLRELLARERFAGPVVDHYIVPMGAAIWSTPPDQLLDFPAATFVRFLHNHGMLSVHDRPQWRTVVGGSRRYVERLARGLQGRTRLSCAVRAVRRATDAVHVLTADGRTEAFDGVIFGAHSDQALAMLQDPSVAERSILGALPYQANDVVLHTDASVLPRARRAWAAWNYAIPAQPRQAVVVTYCMNILQHLDTPQTLCVTLNDAGAVAPERVLRRFVYHHPVFTGAGIAAQARRGEISGHNRTWYCGAYWRYGFHEDGTLSGVEVARDIAGAEAGA